MTTETNSFLTVSSKEAALRTKPGQTCNCNFYSDSIPTRCKSMCNQMVTSEIRKLFHARFVKILIIKRGKLTEF